MKLRLRLILFVLTLSGLVGIIVWTVHTAWRSTLLLERHFQEVQGESYRIADRLNITLQKLNTDFLRYQLGHKEADLNNLSEGVAHFDRWIKQQKHTIEDLQALQIIQQIEAELHMYLQQTMPLKDGAARDEEAILDIVKHIENSYSRLLALGLDWAHLHQSTVEKEIQQSEDALSTFTLLIYITLFTLIIVLLWLSHTVFKELIKPLQSTVIEHRKKLEKQEKIASLGLLAAGVAHEIRNPLAAMKARMYTLSKSNALVSSDREDIDVIGGEIDRLEGIVQSFLDLSRPPRPHTRLIKPDDIVQNLVKWMKLQWEKQGIQIHAHTHTQAMIKADPDQLQQVLINLIRNAAESIDGKGTVTVSTEVKQVNYGKEKKERFCIHISDTGNGIPVDMQKRLFEPFFTTKPEGTGLGLALTRQILQKQGADISFKTIRGNGTTFSILFETADETESEHG